MTNFERKCEKVVEDFMMTIDKIKKDNLNSKQLSDKFTELKSNVDRELLKLPNEDSENVVTAFELYTTTFPYSQRCQIYLEKMVKTKRNCNFF